MTEPQSDPFAPRPWPHRAALDSPFQGRGVALVARGAARDDLAARLRAFGCRLLEPGDEDLEVALLAPSTADELDHALRELRASGASPVVILVADADRGGDSTGSYARLAPHELDDELRTTLGRALERAALEAENRRLRASLDGRAALDRLVTRDPAMRRVLSTLQSVAGTRANVLISGESGTGKTMIARTLHALSDRRDGPFVVVNCGALPESLLESELFGHARGAFTGAVGDRAGRFEEADGGTLFLDEINSASLDLQVKLLHVIQERRFQRVGESRTREVDVRLVTATNRDLLEEIAAGHFREDLYYRIHVVDLHLPPLRERPGDIALLAEGIVSRYAREYGRDVRGLSRRCLQALQGYDWPGNVRELENVLERAVLLSAGPRLFAEDLEAGIALNTETEEPLEGLQLGLDTLARLPLKKALEVPEKAILERALEICGGHRERTARMLQLNRSTLFNKMRKYDLLERDFGAEAAAGPGGATSATDSPSKAADGR